MFFYKQISVFFPHCTVCKSVFVISLFEGILCIPCFTGALKDGESGFFPMLDFCLRVPREISKPGIVGLSGTIAA